MDASPRERKPRCGRLAATGLSAAGVAAYLLWAAFPPCGEAVNVVVALVPLLAFSRLASPRASAAVWFAGGFAFWFATLSWMPAIVKNNGPWPLVALGWAGLAAWCALYFALFGWLDARLWRRARARAWGGWARVAVALVLEPAAWAGLEWLRATLFTGFAWNFLGTALGQMPAFASPARLGGVYFLSALVLMVNGVFATLVERMLAGCGVCDAPDAPLDGDADVPIPAPRGARVLRRLARTAETALPLVAVVAALQIADADLAAAAPLDRPVQTLRVALVQRNAPCVFSAATRENPFKAFGGLMETAGAAEADLAVWAESALVEFGGAVRGEGARGAVRHFAERTGVKAILAGGDDVERLDGERRVYNAAALFTVDETNAVDVAVYRKQHLVPFGEFIPLDKWIRPLQKLSPIGVSIWPGEPKLLAFKGVRLAPLICFEDTDPALARRAAADGAQAIVLVTNDSWFSRSHEAAAHALQAVLRAIETGLPVLRAANSGVTGIISPHGRARWLAEADGTPVVDAPGCQVERLTADPAPPLTPYVRFGDVPLLCAFFLALAFAGWPSVRRKAKNAPIG